MEYGITKRLIGRQNFLEISKEEFDAAKSAHESLGKTLGIEEKFNIILENYREYESELLSLCLNNTIFSDRTWSSFQNEIHIINRRLMNLLTTCRLYLDQIPHNIKSIYGNPNKEELVKQKKAQEYDSHLGYRVVEALRNYAQHRGLPIHNLQYNNTFHPDLPNNPSEHTITPSLRVGLLKEEKRFKSSVLKELEFLGDLVDLKPLVREYMESLGRIHLFLREMLRADITTWDSTVLEIQKSFCERFTEDKVGLAIVARDNTGHVVESVYIIEDLIKHRQWLVRKNRNLRHYNSATVSSESRPGDVLNDKRSK